MALPLIYFLKIIIVC